MSEDDHKHTEHVILAKSTGLKVFIFLLVFTVITVAISRVDFGALNFPIAMLIASVKAFAVVLFFMGLKYDSNDNRVIFGISFVFVLIFLAFTASDIFSRGNWKVVGNPLMEATGGPEFSEPWIATPELINFGKQVYNEQACYTCHGDEGFGNGPAAAALNPAPRNFHEEGGWKNGRTPTGVFKTLTEGLGLMPAYSTVPSAARWAVTHYILSFGSKTADPTAEELASIGIDPSQEGGGSDGAQKKIPVDFAIERYLER